MSLSGWFQDLSGQKECNPCPPGFHCQSLSPSPTRGSATGLSSPLPCPAGYICPRESTDSQPLPCPKGTYNPSQGLTTTGEKAEPLWKKGNKWNNKHYWLAFFSLFETKYNLENGYESKLLLNVDVLQCSLETFMILLIIQIRFS